MTTYAYLLHPRDESAKRLARRRAALAQLVQDRLPGAEMSLVEEAGSRLTPFLERAAVAELDGRLSAGDDFFAFGQDLYAGLPGFGELGRAWLDRGVTLHFAELSDPVAPGTELAEVFFQAIAMFHALSKLARRKG